MRYLLLLVILFGGLMVNAQTTGSNSRGNKKQAATTQEKRGTGQYHGSRDTTPGSPMGTGGAGGDMSGSPAASAIQTDDQTDKANASQDSAASGTDTISKKPTIQKRKSVNRPTRRNL